MRNLAGRDQHETEAVILLELARCGISSRMYAPENSEVHTGIGGVIPHTTKLTRAWAYWIADCRVDIEVARRIYEHPVGRTDIRVAGHCGCPPPDEWAHWRDPVTNKLYTGTKQAAEMEQLKNAFPEQYEMFLSTHLVHDDPRSVGALGTVDLYHVDTELGLYVFAEFLRAKL